MADYIYWISLFSAVVISACSQMLLKKGAQKEYGSFIREYLNVWVISGYFLMFVSTICIIFAYKGVDYKNGPVIESLGFILIMILSRIFFKEKITKHKLIGNILILLGVVVFYFPFSSG